jgi:toxin-antitoxin system PIN domain toxin
MDVNVLVALIDPIHSHYEAAHRWLGMNRRYGWATCPMTVNGCIRIVSNPAYFPEKIAVSEVALRLRDACATIEHHFWEDSVSLLDESLFQPANILGHQKITDAYLLGLAVRNHGRLVTFDRNIPLKAVPGAGARHLAIIGNG